MGCETPEGGELVPVESALDSGGREPLERGENEPADLAWGVAAAGGYLSYGVEKEIRLTELSTSISESLSSGMGIFDARSSESSFVEWNPTMLIDSRTPPR